MKKIQDRLFSDIIDVKNKKISVGLLFPLVLFYYEIVFRQSTVRGIFQWGTVFMLFFCFLYGGIAYLLTTLFKNRRVNYVIGGILILLSAVPFLIQYFVYRQFKVFYDLNTMFGGASDALSGFSSDVQRLVCSVDGATKIALFLIPTILYLVFGRFIKVSRLKWSKKGLTALSLFEIYILIRLGFLINEPMGMLYGMEYNYQAAVSNFGLVTGIRLDVRENISGDEDSFEVVDPITPTNTPTVSPSVTVEPSKEPTNTPTPDPDITGEPSVDPTPTEEPTPTPTPTPIVYEPNQMELNLSGGKGTIADLNKYVASQSASLKNQYTGIFEGKNLIFISAEAFSAEVINPELTPTLYRLATKGINFTDYYQPAGAGTTGGEYQNIFGMLPTDGGKSFKNTADHLNYFTIGSQLDRVGYFGMAFHNNSYTYYSRNITHNNLGYSEGFMGYGNGMEKYVKKQWPQSDLEMFEGTLGLYIDKQPFNVYYMSVSGHSGYLQSNNAMTRKNWDKVKDLPYSEDVRGYFAANLELENALAYLVAELEAKGIANDTVICIATDHFPYGLDNDAALGKMPLLSELYGYSVEDVFQRDHNRLILWCGSLEDEEPIIVDTPTSSLDILPTLSNLFGTEFDSRLMPGRDVFSDAPALFFNASYDWKSEYGTYYSSKGQFVPVDENIELPKDYVANMKAVVRNKIRYCKGVLESDYFRHLFK